MLVLTFSATGRQNCVTVNGSPFIYARTRVGSFMLSSRCPHRGGPLHLACWDGAEPRLVCPWHERRTPVGRSLRGGIPATRRGNVVTAVFPVPADSPHTVEHRPVSADLAGPPTEREEGSCHVAG